MQFIGKGLEPFIVLPQLDGAFLQAIHIPPPGQVEQNRQLFRRRNFKRQMAERYFTLSTAHPPGLGARRWLVACPPLHCSVSSGCPHLTTSGKPLLRLRITQVVGQEVDAAGFEIAEYLDLQRIVTLSSLEKP